MNFPLSATEWQKFFARGKPNTQVISPTTLYTLFGLWLGAFLLKHGGAAFDTAWHFRFFYDEFSPPHNINTVGTALALIVLAYQTWTGNATTARGLFLTWAGWIFFLVSAPIDIANHLINGLDLTTWSPTHFMLYLGTTLMLVGVLYNWLKLAPAGNVKLIFALIIWFLLLDDVMFPLGQQEFGFLSYDSFLRGAPTASPELLAIAGDNVAKYAVYNVPQWLYPIWLTVAASLFLIVARRIQGWAWTATVVTSLYIVFRYTAQIVLAQFQFPGSFIPVMLIGAGVMIDLAARFKWNALLTALIVIVPYYAGAAALGRVTVMPTFELYTAPIALALLCLGIIAWNLSWQKIAQLKASN